ncbi:MAG: prepilin-type N-terminal cleavage/methylation domain-containing protein [Syntrophomonas sp.]
MLRRILRSNSNEEGFTLVELIIVMAILALLASLVVPKFGDILGDSKAKAHEANVQMIQKAVDLYSANTDTPLDDIDDIDVLVDKEYLKAIPDNPMGPGKYTVENGEVKIEEE